MKTCLSVCILAMALFGATSARAQVTQLSTYISTIAWGESKYYDCYEEWGWVWNDERNEWEWGPYEVCDWYHDYYWWIDRVSIYGTTNGCPIRLIVNWSNGYQQTVMLTGNGGTVTRDFFYTSNDPYPQSASAVHAFSPRLNGPQAACADCPVTYSVTDVPSECAEAIHWWRDGGYIGRAGMSLTTSFGNTAGSVSFQVGSGTASHSITTTIVEHRDNPSNGMSWGQISLNVPSISAAMIAQNTGGGWILGRTAGETSRSGKANCDCSTFRADFAMHCEIVAYNYDSRINNGFHRGLIINAEGEHVQHFRTMIDNVRARVTPGRTTSNYWQAVTWNNDNLSIAEQEYQLQHNRNTALDAPGAAHPQLGDRVINENGFSP